MFFLCETLSFQDILFFWEFAGEIFVKVHASYALGHAVCALCINTWGYCRLCSADLALQNRMQQSLHTVQRATDSSLYLNLTPWSHYKCIHLRFSYQGRVRVCVDPF